MAEIRIKPHLQQTVEEARRAEQRRLYRRNQVFGLVILALVVVVWRMFHTGPGWIFPPGWWRP
jgi:t-SNARE complex subunit (syntaxin)